MSFIEFMLYGPNQVFQNAHLSKPSPPGVLSKTPQETLQTYHDFWNKQRNLSGLCFATAVVIGVYVFRSIRSFKLQLPLLGLITALGFHCLRRAWQASQKDKKPEKFLESLNKLLEETPYSINSLAVFPRVLKKGKYRFEDELPKLSELRADVTKGCYDDGSAFVVIKLRSTLTSENVDNFNSQWKRRREVLTYDPDKKEIESFIFLYQDENNHWSQSYKMLPDIFPYFLTGPTSGNLPIQDLLKNGFKTDLSGIQWRLLSR